MYRDQERLSDAGALASAFSEGASMAGTLGGKRAQSDMLPKLNDSLYASTQGEIENRRRMREMEERSNMNDLQVAKYMDDQKPRYKFENDVVGPGNSPVMFSDSGEYKTVPGLKVRERPSSLGISRVVPGYEKEGSVLMQGPDGKLYEEKIDPKFTPKKSRSGKLTEGERNSTALYNNAQNALKVLEEMEAQGFRPTIGTSFKKMVTPEEFEGHVLSDDELRYQQAAEDFTAAKLRLESGAAIPDSEIKQQARIYMRKSGESDNIGSQKASARRSALEGMKFKAGQGAEMIGQGIRGESDLTPEEEEELRQLEAEFGGQ